MTTQTAEEAALDLRRGENYVATGKRISFGLGPNGHELEWIAMGQDACRDLAINGTTGMDLWFRMLMLAQGEMDPYGHAPFYVDEIRETLLRVDPVTGEVSEYRPSSMYNALEKLKRDGLVSEDSTLRCIRLRQTLHQKGVGRRKSCNHR